MSIQRLDELFVQRRHQQCYISVGIKDLRDSYLSMLTKKSFSATIFILVSILSLIFYSKNNITIQALQPTTSLPPPAILQQLLQSEMDATLQQTTESNYDGPILLPCCYDGLSARLIARHQMKSSNPNRTTGSSPKQRFQATFMSGFGVSAIHGIPDTQLISYHEMIQSCSIVAEALQSVATEQELPYPIPCIAVRLQ